MEPLCWADKQLQKKRRLDNKMRMTMEKSTRSGNWLGGWKENDRSQGTKERKKNGQKKTISRLRLAGKEILTQH
jgi:hypothetical protein